MFLSLNAWEGICSEIYSGQNDIRYTLGSLGKQIQQASRNTWIFILFIFDC